MFDGPVLFKHSRGRKKKKKDLGSASFKMEAKNNLGDSFRSLDSKN